MRETSRVIIVVAVLGTWLAAVTLAGCHDGEDAAGVEGEADAAPEVETTPDAEATPDAEVDVEATADAETQPDGDVDAAEHSEPTAEHDGPWVSLSGKIFPFVANLKTDPTGGRVTILEQPGRELIIADAEGLFHFDDLIPGTPITLALEHPDFHPIQTETITLPPAGAERVTFQAADAVVVSAFSGILGYDLDPERCQMVTTVTDVGGTLYGGGERGEAGVTVTVDPPLPPEHGPIYFNANVIPDRALTETSRDGGVLFINVPPGDYTWTGHKDGFTFREIRMGCRAGWLTNASPPWGLQVQE